MSNFSTVDADAGRTLIALERRPNSSSMGYEYDTISVEGHPNRKHSISPRQLMAASATGGPGLPSGTRLRPIHGRRVCFVPARACAERSLGGGRPVTRERPARLVVGPREGSARWFLVGFSVAPDRSDRRRPLRCVPLLLRRPRRCLRMFLYDVRPYLYAYSIRPLVSVTRVSVFFYGTAKLKL